MRICITTAGDSLSVTCPHFRSTHLLFFRYYAFVLAFGAATDMPNLLSYDGVRRIYGRDCSSSPSLMQSLLALACFLFCSCKATFCWTARFCTILGCGTVDLASPHKLCIRISIRKVSFTQPVEDLATHNHLFNDLSSSGTTWKNHNSNKMASPSFDVQAVRSQFPALAHEQVYFDNVSNFAPDALGNA